MFGLNLVQSFAFKLKSDIETVLSYVASNTIFSQFRVLIPGGATYFNQSDGYADAGQHIYEIAQQMNDRGDYFPLFGTCLGFELLIILASGRGEIENRIRCYSFENLPLRFTPGNFLKLISKTITVRDNNQT